MHDEHRHDDGNPLDELLTTDELAALLSMRKSTVEDYARRGILPALKLGRHRRFVRSDVVHALDELRRERHSSGH
jgi:excisionase family DNA binding protein